jgi:DNA end-binding protein Ku
VNGIMVPCANWKGNSELSLLSYAIALFPLPAKSISQRIRLNIINRKTGHRVQNQVLDAQTGGPMERENGNYVLLEEAELDQSALAPQRTSSRRTAATSDTSSRMRVDPWG